MDEIIDFAEWQAEGLRLLRPMVVGPAYVLRLSGGGPNVEAAKKAYELLVATKNKEEWFQAVGAINDALQKLDDELKYRFGMGLYEAAARYG